MKTHPKWVLLGADTLVGREIREVVDDRKLPVRLRACGSAADQRVLSLESEDNFEVLEELSASLLEEAQAILMAGTPEQAAQAVRLARENNIAPAFIDVCGHYENEATGAVRAPAFEREPAAVAPLGFHVVAHPAAVALSTALEAIHRAYPVRHSIATVFESASARGSEGVDELHRQTLHLFNFQSLPTKIFGVQASFNILPRLGAEAAQPLEASEARIRRHLAALLDPCQVPVPSLQLVHAPVFSGYCSSLWVEFESRPATEAVQEQLSSAGVDFWSPEDGPLTNTSLAGQSGTLVSRIHNDEGHPGAIWLWLACDNIRETAINAIALAGLAGKGA